MPDHTSNSRLGRYKPPPVRPLAPVDAVVDEGVLIVLSAARMAVKNYILRSALRDGVTFDHAEVSAFARNEVNRLADEDSATAERLDAVVRLPAPTSERRSEARRLHEAAIERAPEVHRRLADALRVIAADPDQIAELVRSAQRLAAEELQQAVSRRLISRVIEPDDGDMADRDKRLRQLIRSDIKALKWRARRNALRDLAKRTRGSS